MESALAWIGQVAEWIGRWIPRWVVLDVMTGGIKYVRGRPYYCPPGRIHWYWPAITTFDTYPVVRQADDLRSQTIVTADNRIIIVGGMIVYEVDDLMKLLPRVFKAEQAIRDMTLACIHSVCCGLTLDELRRMQRKGTLDTKLRNEARKSLEAFGVGVIKVQLTDLAPARVLKVFQTVGKDE